MKRNSMKIYGNEHQKLNDDFGVILNVIRIQNHLDFL